MGHFSNDFLPDFSYAAYRSGSTDLPASLEVVIDVDDFGATADDGKDDSKAIIAAIAHASAIEGPVIVRFGSGRYRITEILKIERSEIVLQGTGSGDGDTMLHFPRPLNQVDESTSLDEFRKYIVKLDKRQKEADLNLDEYFSEYSWSGGFIWIQKPGVRTAPYLEEYDPEIVKLADIVSGTRGSNSLQLSVGAGIEANDIVQLQWINSSGPDAGIIQSLYGSESDSAGSHHWSFPQRPLVRQTSRVQSVDGNRITLADPLLHDANDSIPSQVASWDGLQNVGVEELRIEFPDSPYFGHHMERGYNGIYFTSAFDSWARNIRITNADSGILSYNSANLTYRDILSDGTRKAHYAVHMGNVHNVLAENITVMNPVLHSLTFNTQSTKCVYKNAAVFVTPTLDQHAGSNHQNLFDNVTLHMRAVDSDDGPVVATFDGSGAGYWQPGHGGFNTTWNLRILVTGGANADETVTVQGLYEGPMARIIGLHGNREFELDYRPEPYVEMLNQELTSVPSLYDYQKKQRLNQWQLVDDFESADGLQGWTNIDAENDTDPFVPNPQVSEIREDAESDTQYMLRKPAADGVVGNRKAIGFKALPVPIPVGETFTLYARFSVESFPNNQMFGLSSSSAADIPGQNYDALEPMLRITDKAESNGQKNDGTLMVVSGYKTYSKIINPETGDAARPLQPGVWYEVWCVANNATQEMGGQRYDLYLRGGEFAQQRKVFSGAAFRMQREQPLSFFMAISNTGPHNAPYGNGGVRYDDIFLAPGRTLSTPPR